MLLKCRRRPHQVLTSILCGPRTSIQFTLYKQSSEMSTVFLPCLSISFAMYSLPINICMEDCKLSMSSAHTCTYTYLKNVPALGMRLALNSTWHSQLGSFKKWLSRPGLLSANVCSWFCLVYFAAFCFPGSDLIWTEEYDSAQVSPRSN